VTFPPIQYPCYQGIDFPTREELIVPAICKGDFTLGNVNESVKKYLEVHSLGYIDRKNMGRGIGLSLNELCNSCVTGDYSCLKYKPVFRTRAEMKK